MFTVMNMFAKMLSVNHSVIEIAFYRNLIACIPFLIMIFAFGRREILVIHSKPSLVGIRAVIGTVSLVTTFAAYSLMPMADTTALLFTASLFIPVLGVIENMSMHICTSCGHEEAIFGTGGAEEMVSDFDIPLLGQLPLDARIREQTDGGTPTVISDPDSAVADIYRKTAIRIAAAQSSQRTDYSSKFGTIVVEGTS